MNYDENQEKKTQCINDLIEKARARGKITFREVAVFAFMFGLLFSFAGDGQIAVGRDFQVNIFFVYAGKLRQNVNRIIAFRNFYFRFGFAEILMMRKIKSIPKMLQEMFKFFMGRNMNRQFVGMRALTGGQLIFHNFYSPVNVSVYLFGLNLQV